MLHHVTNEVLPAQLQQCIAFYETLGFRPVTAPEGIAGRAIWLERGATQVHLMPKEGAAGAGSGRAAGGQSGRAAGGQSGRAAGGRSGHFAVVVDRYEATTERLRADGYEVEDRRAHWGSPRSYVRDPAGYLVELVAWPPGGGA